MQSRLIYDIGMNNGEDSAFYLAKGFDVVAIEASPILAGQARENFADYIKSGQLTILNIGIWSENKTLQFYRNLSNDHWSSFDPAYGCRGGTPFEVIDIECQRIADVIRRFGIPYYMKIDVEGADKIILKDMLSIDGLPEYASVEEYGVQAIDDLKALGYKRFQIVPQRTKDPAEPQEPAREGSYVKRSFDGRDSGSFGKELYADRWLSYEEARSKFLTTVRTERYEYVGPEHEWHDIHATTVDLIGPGPRC